MSRPRPRVLAMSRDTPVSGIVPLREAIAAKFKRETGP